MATDRRRIDDGEGTAALVSHRLAVIRHAEEVIGNVTHA